MWLWCIVFFCVGVIIGAVIGVLYMEQSNDDYKNRVNDLERALMDSKAPYEILARDKQEVKYDDNAWW